MRLRLVLVSGFVLATLAGCGDAGGSRRNPDPESVPAAWERLPDPPLSRRSSPVVAWTGTELLVIGGDTSAPCPPGADCVGPDHHARDGAAYRPDEKTWRAITPAPADIPPGTQSAQVGGRLYLLAGQTLLEYDVAGDTWSRPTTPQLAWSWLVADGSRLLFVSGSDEQGVRPDRVYDPAADRWSVLPDDPIGPAYDRNITATSHGLVLTAKELVDNPGGGDRPSLVLAAVLEDGTWRRLPDSDQLGGWRWAWTGARLVDPTLGGSDGGGDGAGDYGRWFPNGGILDPATGTWSRLPNAPKERTGGWPVETLGGPAIAAEGWLFDERDESWTRVPSPSDAPEQPGPAVWVGDRLVVVGGVHEDRGDTVDALSPRVWIWSSALTTGKNL